MAWISFGSLPCKKTSCLDVVEIARVPDMLPSVFPSWSVYLIISTPVFRPFVYGDFLLWLILVLPTHTNRFPSTVWYISLVLWVLSKHYTPAVSVRNGSEACKWIRNTISTYIYIYISILRGKWLRHFVTSRKVTGSIPDGVIGIFRWNTSSGRTVALELTQLLTEMSTRNISSGLKAAGG